MSFVNEKISKRIEEIAIELTNIFSVVDTKGEIDVSEIYLTLKKIQKTYFLFIQKIS